MNNQTLVGDGDYEETGPTENVVDDEKMVTDAPLKNEMENEKIVTHPTPTERN